MGRLDRSSEGEFWQLVDRLEAGGPDAARSLLAGLDAPSESTRLGCAKALLVVGSGPSREKAIQSIGDLATSAKDLEVRSGAIDLYSRYGDPDEAFEALSGPFESASDPALVIPLASALWELDHLDAARDRLLKLVRSRDPEVRADAALALADMDYTDGDVRAVLSSLAKEPSPRGRRAAALLRLTRLGRQLDRRIEQGDILLEGTDPAKLLRIREERIRELEEQLERSGRTGPATPDREETPLDRTLDEVVRLIQKHYVDADRTEREELLTAAVRGMVRSLDEYSQFMEPETSRNFGRALRGEYPGIGAQVTKPEDGPLEILRPIYGGPAFRSGLRSGDRIVSIDGVDTHPLAIDEIAPLLRGEEGSEVELRVWRRGWTEYREFRVRRETIELPSVHHEMLPRGVGYLQLSQFGDKSAAEFQTALEDLRNAGLRGLVIDLRRNPGGRLDVAETITDLFVEGDLPIRILKGRGPAGAAEDRRFPTDRVEPDYPIVVLIDERSASAAEILSGALQDHGRALLVGQRTFGKGTVQSLFDVRSLPGSRLKLTTMYYFLPLERCIHTRRDAKGRIIEQGGVQPDLPVEMVRLPTWRVEERAAIRTRPEILEYVERHLDELAALVPYGDLGDATRYPGIGALTASLGPRVLEEDVRAVVRWNVRRKLEDRRGRPYAVALQEDDQLQAALLALLARMGERPDADPVYAWVASHRREEEKKAATGRDEKPGDEGPGDDSGAAESPAPTREAAPAGR